MPIALFLIAAIVSSTMFVHMQSIAQNTPLNDALLASTAAFYAASSSAEITWGVSKSISSAEGLKEFNERRQKNEAERGNKGFLGDVTFTGGATSLELNKGRVAGSVRTKMTSSPMSFLEEYRQPSGEVLMMDIQPHEAPESFQVDYCIDGEPCPDLVVEWFRFSKDFSFHDLTSLEDLDNLEKLEIEESSLSPCITDPVLKTTRCLVNTGETGDLGGLTVGDSKRPGYLKGINLRLQGSSYHYLIRFRSDDKSSFYFKIYGLDGVNKEMPLPNTIMETDETGNAGLSFRRIREQKLIHGGFQEGLEYSHFTHTFRDTTK